MATHEMREMAKMAAKEAVVETFMMLGLDIKDPISVQNQFSFMRNLYYSARHIRNVMLAAVATTVVSGICWAIWAAVKIGAFAAGVK